MPMTVNMQRTANKVLDEQLRPWVRNLHGEESYWLTFVLLSYNLQVTRLYCIWRRLIGWLWTVYWKRIWKESIIVILKNHPCCLELLLEAFKQSAEPVTVENVSQDRRNTIDFWIIKIRHIVGECRINTVFYLDWLKVLMTKTIELLNYQCWCAMTFPLQSVLLHAYVCMLWIKKHLYSVTP
jgi:hypothetical protein